MSKFKKYASSWTYGNVTGWGGWSSKKSYGLFQNEMTGTTSVFGRDKEIEVTFSGNESWAKNNVINFPALSETTELDNDMLLLCRGFVDHAAAKIRFSDKDIIKSVRMNNEKSDPLLWHLFNSIESVRVEDKYIQQYPGATKNLAETADKQAKEFKDQNNIGWNDTLPLSKAAPMAISAEYRRKKGYFGFNLSDVGRAIVENKEKENIDGWVEDIKNLENTQESLELARNIYEYIKENPSPEPEDKPEDKKGEGEKGENKGDADKGGNDKKEAPEGDAPSPASGDKPSEKEKPEESKPEAAAPKTTKDNPFNYMPRLDEIINDGLRECESYSVDGDLPYKVWTKEYDKVHHWSDAATFTGSEHNPNHCLAPIYMRQSANVTSYMSMASELGPVINVARRKLELMIAAQRKIEWDFLKDRGKFDAKRMAAALNCDPHVFKIKENAADIDTAVTVLVDLSGSMNGEKRHVATQTAIVLFECLSKIGIPFEVIGFDCLHSFPDALNPPKEYNQIVSRGLGAYTRVESLHTYVFKAFKDRPFDARPYIMGLADPMVGNANNADGESLVIAHERLYKRPEKRKIMFVLSDGHPSCQTASLESQRKYLKKVVKNIENKGTDIIGIGIMTDAVSSYYKKHVVCHQAKDLTGTALKLLSDLLLEKKDKKKKVLT